MSIPFSRPGRYRGRGPGGAGAVPIKLRSGLSAHAWKAFVGACENAGFSIPYGYELLVRGLLAKKAEMNYREVSERNQAQGMQIRMPTIVRELRRDLQKMWGLTGQGDKGKVDGAAIATCAANFKEWFAAGFVARENVK